MLKKSILLAVFITAFLFSFANLPVIKRTKTGGIAGAGFNTVSTELTSRTVILNGVEVTWTGWDIFCSGYGFQSCPKEGPFTFTGGNGYDDVDEVQGTTLLNYADNQINNSTLSGTYQVTVQVASESFLRVYTVTWSGSDAANNTVEVDRVNIY